MNTLLTKLYHRTSVRTNISSKDSEEKDCEKFVNYERETRES